MQGWQAFELAEPFAGLKVPAGQAMQLLMLAELLFGLNVPGGHREHLGAPLSGM